METWSQGVVLGLIAASGPEDKAKVAIIVLNMVVSFIRECVLAETQDAHDTVIKPPGTSEVRDRDVDVIDANSLGAHGVGERPTTKSPTAVGKPGTPAANPASANRAA